MAERAELVHVVLDVAKRTINGDQYKDEALVDTLERYIPPDEHVRLAFIGSIGRRMNCFLVCTNFRLIVAEYVNRVLGWKAESLSFSKMDGARMIEPDMSGGFWRTMGEMAFRSCEIDFVDGTSYSVSALDSVALERLVEITSEGVERWRRHQRQSERGIHIGSVNRGNVSISSSGVYQAVSINDDMAEALLYIRRTLEGKDAQLYHDEREEALADVDTLETELSKPSPNKRIVNLILDNLERLPQIAAAVNSETRASLAPPLRSGTKLALACSGTSSHGLVLGVELEQPLRRRSCIQISQRLGKGGQPRRSSGRTPPYRAVPPLTLSGVGRQAFRG